jgi:hypothetical protein
MNRWHKYKFVFDASDLGKLDMFIDGDNTSTTRSGTVTGTATFDFTDTKIRFGQQYDSSIDGNCSFRNVRIR